MFKQRFRLLANLVCFENQPRRGDQYLDAFDFSEGGSTALAEIRDKLALKKDMSPTDRERFLARRSSRFHSGWAWAILIMAIIAVPIHALGIEKEPLWQRLLYSGLAGLLVLNFLLGRRNRNSGNQVQPEEHPSSEPNE